MRLIVPMAARTGVRVVAEIHVLAVVEALREVEFSIKFI